MAEVGAFCSADCAATDAGCVASPPGAVFGFVAGGGMADGIVAREEDVFAATLVVVGDELGVAVFDDERLFEARPMEAVGRNCADDGEGFADIAADGGGMPVVWIFGAVGFESFVIDAVEVDPFVALGRGRVRVFEDGAAEWEREKVIVFGSGEVAEAEFGTSPVFAVG